MNFVSLFSGGGGADLGFLRQGFENKLAVEYNPDIAKVYEQNLGPILCCPVNKLSVGYLKSLGSIDVIIGGPPCQSFSEARSVSGGKSTLEGLTNVVTMKNIVHTVKPKIFICENVGAVLNNPVVLHTFSSWTDYKVACVRLNTADYGVPQSRVRAFFIGLRCDTGFQHHSFQAYKKESVGWAPFLGLSSGYWMVKRSNGKEARMAYEDSFTVTCAGNLIARVKHSVFGKVDRYLTVREYAKLQGFPEDYLFPKNTCLARTIIGNAWSVNVSTILAKECKKWLDI
jgi:DNA (cytosine-5)-methyltransferase 1